MDTQITNYDKPVGRLIPKIFSEPYSEEIVTVIAMVEDGYDYCSKVCTKEPCTQCNHRGQKCGFPVTFKLIPITVSPEYEGDPEDELAYSRWICQIYKPPRPEWSCGDKPEDYIITLKTQEQRYDSIIEWLGVKGYYFNPTAHNGVMKPNGTPATFDCLMEEIYQWLLHNRGHTGIDDYIIAIARYRNGASNQFLGSFIGSKKNGLVARIYEQYALRANLPDKITISEAKKLGYSKSQLLQAGYIEKQFKGKRFMVKS